MDTRIAGLLVAVLVWAVLVTVLLGPTALAVVWVRRHRATLQRMHPGKVVILAAVVGALAWIVRSSGLSIAGRLLAVGAVVAPMVVLAWAWFSAREQR